MSWSLRNVFQMNKQYPYTFYIPSKSVIDRLSIGNFVKLIFENEDGGERMWVEITKREGNSFIGLLDNQPYEISDLNIGDEINFTTEHICASNLDEPESIKWDFYFDTKVAVTNDVLEKRIFNFMNRGDSGWTIYTGSETDEYLNDEDNYQIVSIGVVLNIDDSILEFYDEQPLCAFERDDSDKFHKIDDYDFE